MRVQPSAPLIVVFRSLLNGDVVETYSVVGHNDGLRVNPHTKRLWALQNEDGNPNLVIIDTASGTQTVYTFGPTPHGGGYDEIAFRGSDVFLSASNPSSNPKFGSKVVRATISGSTVNVSEVLNGIAAATDIPTDAPLTLNLQDPDSMIFNRFGDLALDSQADGELIIVHHLGFTDQSVYHLGLTLQWRRHPSGRSYLRDGHTRSDFGIGSRCWSRRNHLLHLQKHFLSRRRILCRVQFGRES